MGRPIIYVLNGLFLVFFALAAAVQYNDPDPLLWMSIYGAGALCCALYMAGRLSTVLSGLISGVCLLGVLYLLLRLQGSFVDETGQEMMGLVEETREMFGLLLIALWTGVLTWRVHRASPRGTPSSEAIS